MNRGRGLSHDPARAAERKAKRLARRAAAARPEDAARDARAAARPATFPCKRCGVTVKRRNIGAGYCRACSQIVNAAKGGPPRRGVALTCAVCGDAFYATQHELRRGRRYCSQRCMGIASRKKRVCSVCGKAFTAPRGLSRKTCSPECHRRAGSTAKRGRKNPNYVTGRRSVEGWRSALADACAICGSTQRLALHHVVYEQHVRRMGGDCADPTNALTVCFTCHMAHHHGGDHRIPLDRLRPENIVFARELLGAYADDYLARYYDAGDLSAPWRAKPRVALEDNAACPLTG